MNHKNNKKAFFNALSYSQSHIRIFQIELNIHKHDIGVHFIFVYIKIILYFFMFILVIFLPKSICWYQSIEWIKWNYLKYSAIELNFVNIICSFLALKLYSIQTLFYYRYSACRYGGRSIKVISNYMPFYLNANQFTPFMHSVIWRLTQINSQRGT